MPIGKRAARKVALHAAATILRETADSTYIFDDEYSPEDVLLLCDALRAISQELFRRAGDLFDDAKGEP